MLTEKLIDAGLFLMDTILNFLDVLPPMPDKVVEMLDWFFTTIFEHGWNGACFFLPMDYVLVLLPLVLVVTRFEDVYHLVMWVLRKIPVLGIE